MVISGQEYFELCHQRFLQKASEDTCSDSFIRVGGRLTVRIKFAGKHLVSPFMRALAHLSTSEVESPELTVCIWDDPSSSRNLLLYPFSGDIEKTKRHKAGNIEIACELWPQRLSLFSAERKLALFWVNDVNEYPWYERCRPLRYIIHWWALQHKLYLVHAACIGTAGGGLLVTGRKGAGKSTTALSSLDSDLSYLADDLCLIGFEGKQVFAYSLYNTAKLDNFEKLPGLEKHVHNRHRVPGEKAILYVHDRFPDKLLLKVPVLAILVPKLIGEHPSNLVPISNNEAFNVLSGSTGQELGGTSQEDFFGPYRICKTLPCYRLEAGADLNELNEVISAFIAEREKNAPSTESVIHPR